MTYFDPFRDMNRLFNDTMQASTAMPMDLYQSGEAFVAEIDLPGVDPASIDIDVDDRTLTIRAQRPSSSPQDAKWLSHERASGTFARQLSLGRGLALDKIEASYGDGVLRLTIPVAEEAKPRKISVTHSAESNKLQVEQAESK